MEYKHSPLLAIQLPFETSTDFLFVAHQLNVKQRVRIVDLIKMFQTIREDYRCMIYKDSIFIH